MMGNLAKRVDALEGRTVAETGVWHRLIWPVGEAWSQVLADYGSERIGSGDNVMVVELIGGAEGQRQHDPVRERDKPAAEAWLAAHDARRYGGGNSVVTNNKGGARL